MGRATSGKLCPLLPYGNCYWEVYSLFFWGGGEGVFARCVFIRGESFLGREISEELIFKGKCYTGGFMIKLIYEILFNCLTFSLLNLCGDIPGELSMGYFPVCFAFGKIISMEGSISGVVEKPIRG